VTLRVTEPSTLLPEYLAAWIVSPLGRQQLLRLARGSGIQRIAFSDVFKLAVPLPPMDVQTDVCNRLSGFSDAIAEHRRVVDTLNELREIELTWLFRGHATSESTPANPPGRKR
jgi:restriction endonuclease S subunit